MRAFHRVDGDSALSNAARVDVAALTNSMYWVIRAGSSDRFLGSLISDVTPGDPLAVILVCVGLGVLSVAAAVIPANRAARIDPRVTLTMD